MRTIRHTTRRTLAALLVPAAALILGLSAPASAVRLTGARYFTAPDMTRLVFDLSGSSEFTSELSPDSLRLSIHMQAASLAPNLGDLVVGDSTVRSVSLRSVTGGGVRAEVALVRATATRVFALSSSPGHPHRIVVDVNRYFTPQESARREQVVEAASQAPDRVVVIDPGHGGDAPGAQGPRGLFEKDVTLGIGRKVAARLNAQPGIKAVLTRDGDYDMPLRRRFQMAEKYHADIFMSIHCNSSRDHDAHGTEVYFLSLNGATDEASKELAEEENSADPTSQLPDPNDNVKNILFDLRQNDTIKKSSELADMVLQSLSAREGLVFRGVKQAGFAVLKSPQVPSILVETAFISNRREASWLNSAGFQEDMAGLLTQGIQSYLGRYPNHHRAVARVVAPPETSVAPAAFPVQPTEAPPATSSGTPRDVPGDPPGAPH